MIIEHSEEILSNFEGTIIDIETIGKFNKSVSSNDSRRYMYIKQVIFGYIQKDHIHIHCAEGENAIEKLRHNTIEILNNIENPIYAFNCDFERGVWFHHLGVEIEFNGELKEEKYEKKANAVKILKIPNYDDPFCDRGDLCLIAWEKGDYKNAIAHNRACLLKERDILLKRQYRVPDRLIFNK
jgi:hypothetical protein